MARGLIIRFSFFWKYHISQIENRDKAMTDQDKSTPTCDDSSLNGNAGHDRVDTEKEESKRQRNPGRKPAPSDSLFGIKRELDRALDEWVEASKNDKGFPPTETAKVISAIVRRYATIGLIGIIATFIPIMLLIWQGFEMHNQNKSVIEQNIQLRQQNELIYQDIRHRTEIESRLAIFEGKGGPIAQRALTDLIKLLNDQNQPLSILDFSGANFSGSNFISMDLSYTFFNGANLKNATFISTDLYHTQFHRADLSGAYLGTGDTSNSLNLRESNFAMAKLDKAILSDSDFQGAFMDNASMKEIEAFSSNFDKCRLNNVNFFNATLQASTFRQAELCSADMSGAQIIGANFVKAELQNAKFINARVEEALFRKAILKYADFTNANVSGANFSGAWLFGAKLKFSEFDRAIFKQACYNERTILPFSDKEAKKRGMVRFGPGSDLQGINATDYQYVSYDNIISAFSNANLRGANLRGADLHDVFLGCADLTDAILEDAILKGTIYTDCTRLPFSDKIALQKGMVKQISQESASLDVGYTDEEWAENTK